MLEDDGAALGVDELHRDAAALELMRCDMDGDLLAKPEAMALCVDICGVYVQPTRPGDTRSAHPAGVLG